jgi:hypothetical protein
LHIDKFADFCAVCPAGEGQKSFCLFSLDKQGGNAMMKKCLVVVGVFMALITVLGLLWWATGDSYITPVEIILNLEDDGWYWTQFCLPENGELMVQTELEQCLSLDIPRILVRAGVNHGRFFCGYFCCGETIEGRYVYLPDPNEEKTLVFFAEDGSIWQIFVPEAIFTPQEGRLSTKAIVYH